MVIDDDTFKRMANRFCSTPLPDSVCADLNATVQGPGRHGTNLLTVAEAEVMLRRALRPITMPPESEWVPRVFRREDVFYILNLPVDEDLQEHVDRNPGIIRIEDIVGKQLWPAPPAAV